MGLDLNRELERRPYIGRGGIKTIMYRGEDTGRELVEVSTARHWGVLGIGETMVFSISHESGRLQKGTMEQPSIAMLVNDDLYSPHFRKVFALQERGYKSLSTDTWGRA